MTSVYKKIRHTYWLLTHFFKKNVRALITSFIIGFLLIIVFINFFPYIQGMFIRKNEVIGIVGTYSLQSLPGEVTQLISSPLITIDSDGDIKPVLAHSFQVLDNGLTYRFHLKDDLYWTDKKPFKAEDISYNLKGVTTKAVDPLILDFKLEQQLTIFPIYLTQPLIKYPLEGVGALYSVDRYKVTENILKSVTLSPNKYDLPYKVFKFYTTEEDLIQAYKKGEITQFSTASKNVRNGFQNWKNTELKKEVNPSEIMTLFMDTQSEFLKDRDVRKAIAYALPDFEEYGVNAKSPIPPTSWAFSEEVKEYPFNVERARSLLGIKERETPEKTATLQLYTYFDFISVAEEIKEALKEIGIDVQLKIVSYRPEKFDLLLTVWNPPVDPDQYFFWHSTQVENTNLTKFANSKIDTLLEDGRKIINVKQRRSIYADFQKLITDEIPAAFLYHPYEYTIVRK